MTVSGKKRMSAGAVKTLAGIGIAFGTVVVFIVSFFLAFSFIINPITPISVGAEDAEGENRELRTQVKVLEDEIELLNTTIEKYRSAAAAPKDEHIETQSQEEKKSEPSEKNEDSGKDKQKPSKNTEKEKAEEFIPDTVVTPEGGNEADVPAEEPIIIIDISE